MTHNEFTEIYNKYYLEMLKYASKLNLRFGEDITQDAFLQLYKQKNIREPKGFLITTVKHLSITEFRKKENKHFKLAYNGHNNKNVKLSDLSTYIRKNPVEIVELEEERAKYREWINGAMDYLTPNQQKLCRLKLDSNKNIEEIAEILKIKPYQAHQRYYNLKKQLKEYLIQTKKFDKYGNRLERCV